MSKTIAIGRRVLFLRSLDIDREQFWALLLPFLNKPPSIAETLAWYEHGLLPPAIIKAAQLADEQLIARDQFPRRR